jgi:hypothetical protein
MTGPENYAEAGRLIELAADPETLDTDAAIMLQMAQVHATLALTAATALESAGLAVTGETAGAWRKVIL